MFRILRAVVATALIAALVWPASGQPVQIRRTVESRTVTYNRDIAPIVFAHCATCHRPDGSAPVSLTTYEQTRSRARLIARVTADRFMPPWKPEPGYGDFAGERRLTAAQIETIQAWVDQGAIEGDPADAPPTPSWPGGWQLGTPDLVVEMPQAYVLPAGGSDVLRNFAIPIPIASRRYVKGIEFRPGNPAVVHHANMRIDQTRASRRLDEEDPEPGYEGVTASSAHFPSGHFLGWTPGQVRRLAADDLSWSLEPESDLVLQLHLRPTGKAETVRPSIGFFFTDTPPARVPSMIRLERQDIDIPAGEREYLVEDRFVLPVDVELHELQPHAHLLARQIQALARLPDGSTRWLVYIKDWDFSWQDVYRLAVPLALPKGTTLLMRYTYDNSADNVRNPHHPPARVRFGQKSTDEMGSLWLQVFPRTREEQILLERQVQQKMLREDIVGFQQLLGEDPNNASLHENLAACYLELGQGEAALFHLRASVRLNPRSAVAHNNMGRALVTLGRTSEAIPHLEEALRLEIPNPASVHNALGVALQAQRKVTDAIAHYRQALLLEPNSSFAHNNLGKALHALGRSDEAIGEFEQAIALRPEDPVPYRNLGSVLVSEGRVREGVARFRTALARRPDWLDVLIELGWILAAHPDADVRAPEEAIRLAQRAAELTLRQQLAVLDLLAAAYAAASQFDLAIRTAQAALALADGSGVGPQAAEIRARLQLYEQHRPYRLGFSGVPPQAGTSQSR